MNDVDHNVKIAELKVARKPDRLITILGSCVALCLWEKESGLGGLAHVVLPEGSSEVAEEKGKYADSAVGALAERMERKGARREFMEARIYGGASMFFSVPVKNSLNIGERNCTMVRKHLAELGIPLKEEDVGGASGRKIIFDLATGRVLVKKLS